MGEREGGAKKDDGGSSFGVVTADDGTAVLSTEIGATVGKLEWRCLD